jgi:hypothetical protein
MPNPPAPQPDPAPPDRADATRSPRAAPPVEAPAGTRPALQRIPRAPLGRVLVVVAACAATVLGDPARAASRAAAGPAAETELTGDWVLNAAASQILTPPPTSGRRGPPDAATPTAPEDSVLPDPPARTDADGVRRPPPRRRAPSWLVRPERLEALRALLGETRSLSIVQTPTYVDLRSELSSRSLEIDAESQVSLPTGELADQKVRWQGGRLVVERRVPRGVKIVETFQRLTATDQLEVTVRRSGGPDDGLGKVDLRRVFDRERAEASASSSSGSVPGPGPGPTGSRSATSEVGR